MTEYSAKVITSIDDILPEQWHVVFNSDYPFYRHQFLQALEQSGCVSAEKGWQPLHVLIYQGSELAAAMPCYLKSHSYGEYIFDWNWADAYQRHGLDYYPKLVSAVPFTPATGPRFGISPKFSSQTNKLLALLVSVIKQLQSTYKTSNWQCLFAEQEQNLALAKLEATTRTEVQYHWQNKDYQCFADFIAKLTSRKRKAINKERNAVIKSGISFNWLKGDEITPSAWQQFYQYYKNTYLKRSGHDGYLNYDFFSRLSLALGQQVLLLQAINEQGDVIACALFFRSSSHLYGRYWGASEEFEFLHFETCYYQGIEFCISENIQCFDAGAQGEHKLKRGFEPKLTLSNYLLNEGPFNEAIESYIAQEKHHHLEYIEQAKRQLPFKND
ncbi:GNAT family N-acetyltransferase [Thalassomonas sp. M1454]|uniref:GNAT family N-acetyltransferase n=1 Tax=Thalassomonas sp. M1454 TaxID=2594477 RepID=UPI001180C38B|nr:GNAT family N-acetyltransferase [Thalassomonas sp. M1454]TRX55651.1 N-acetyltransferase [Thalassomonas sp. M1454]